MAMADGWSCYDEGRPTGAFYVGNGVAGGCWDDDITSDEMDHSRKFPTKHQ